MIPFMIPYMKVTPNDRDLLFQGKQFEIIIFRKQRKLAQHVN